MIVELKGGQKRLVERLFEKQVDSLIQTFTQGYMGRGWADCCENPSCAQIIVGDFCFFAGDAGHPCARELVANYRPLGSRNFLLDIPPNEEWGELIEEVYGLRQRRIQRYAIRKDEHHFDQENLRSLSETLPDGYRMVPIDGELYHRCREEAFAMDFVSNFLDEDDFLKRGMGFVILHGGELAAGASSYTIYDGGIEIEIGTREGHRRKGLAAACGARLVLECLERGLYPSWDAANLASMGLAQQLGYVYEGPYPAYEVTLEDLGGESPMPKV